ncbi:hypothetical protein HN587_05605 [Candidatus Woesearchaeota archaeon]|jgi:hypothetical protein|nr:hypothetical protein [Candidatus Woesearchaeota archaeon]
MKFIEIVCVGHNGLEDSTKSRLKEGLISRNFINESYLCDLIIISHIKIPKYLLAKLNPEIRIIEMMSKFQQWLHLVKNRHAVIYAHSTHWPALLSSFFGMQVILAPNLTRIPKSWSRRLILTYLFNRFDYIHAVSNEEKFLLKKLEINPNKIKLIPLIKGKSNKSLPSELLKILNEW